MLLFFIVMLGWVIIFTLLNFSVFGFFDKTVYKYLEEKGCTRFRDGQKDFTILAEKEDIASGDWILKERSYVVVAACPGNIFAKYYILKGNVLANPVTIPRWSSLHKKIEEFNKS